MKVQVMVFPRKGVRDPQGEAVLDKLKRLDWLDTPVTSVAVGRVLVLEVEETDTETVRETVNRMCQEFLANGVVEQYEITCLED